VTRVLNADGGLFKAYPKKCQQVMKPNTADTVNDILRGVMQPGGFGADLALDKPSAGKTGTIDSNMAVWFCGYTPTMATAAMVAGANQKGHWVTLNGQTLNGSYVPTAHGSTTAGPMWADAMQSIQDLLPERDFVQPTLSAGDVHAGTIVPNVIGMTIDDATKILEDAGFQVSVGSTIPAELGKGLVVQTSPQNGATAYDGATITLYPSSGPDTSRSTDTGGDTGGATGDGTGGDTGGSTRGDTKPGNGNGRGGGRGNGH
jgi:membrane peptidoglycan carboxypeptidase